MCVFAQDLFSVEEGRNNLLGTRHCPFLSVTALSIGTHGAVNGKGADKLIPSSEEKAQLLKEVRALMANYQANIDSRVPEEPRKSWYLNILGVVSPALERIAQSNDPSQIEAEIKELKSHKAELDKKLGILAYADRRIKEAKEYWMSHDSIAKGELDIDDVDRLIHAVVEPIKARAQSAKIDEPKQDKEDEATRPVNAHIQ